MPLPSSQQNFGQKTRPEITSLTAPCHRSAALMRNSDTMKSKNVQQEDKALHVTSFPSIWRSFIIIDWCKGTAPYLYESFVGMDLRSYGWPTLWWIFGKIFGSLA